jgi:hypothetical protein
MDAPTLGDDVRKRKSNDEDHSAEAPPPPPKRKVMDKDMPTPTRRPVLKLTEMYDKHRMAHLLESDERRFPAQDMQKLREYHDATATTCSSEVTFYFPTTTLEQLNVGRIHGEGGTFVLSDALRAELMPNSQYYDIRLNNSIPHVLLQMAKEHGLPDVDILQRWSTHWEGELRNMSKTRQAAEQRMRQARLDNMASRRVESSELETAWLASAVHEERERREAARRKAETAKEQHVRTAALAIIASERQAVEQLMLKLFFGGHIDAADRQRLDGDLTAAEAYGQLVTVLAEKEWAQTTPAQRALALDVTALQRAWPEVAAVAAVPPPSAWLAFCLHTREREIMLTLIRYWQEQQGTVRGLNGATVALQTDHADTPMSLQQLLRAAEAHLGDGVTLRELIHEYDIKKLDLETNYVYITEVDGFFDRDEQRLVRLNDLYLEDDSFLAAWYHDPQRQDYARMDMCPDLRLCPADTFNVWVPFKYAGVWPECRAGCRSIYLVERLLWDLSGHDEATKVGLRQWIAHLVHYPERPCRICPILVSKDPASTQLLVDMLQPLLMSAENTSKVTVERNSDGLPSEESSIWGHQNSRMAHSALVVLMNESEGMNQVHAAKIQTLGQTLAITETDSDEDNGHKSSNVPPFQYSIHTYHRFMMVMTKLQKLPRCSTQHPNWVLQANNTMSETLGYELKEMLGKPDMLSNVFAYFLHVPDVDTFEARFHAARPSAPLPKTPTGLLHQHIKAWLKTLADREPAGTTLKLTCAQTHARFAAYCQTVGYNPKKPRNAATLAREISGLGIEGVSTPRNNKQNLKVFEMAAIQAYFAAT